MLDGLKGKADGREFLKENSKSKCASLLFRSFQAILLFCKLHSSLKSPLPHLGGGRSPGGALLVDNDYLILKVVPEPQRSLSPTWVVAGLRRELWILHHHPLHAQGGGGVAAGGLQPQHCGRLLGVGVLQATRERRRGVLVMMGHCRLAAGRLDLLPLMTLSPISPPHPHPTTPVVETGTFESPQVQHASSFHCFCACHLPVQQLLELASPPSLSLPPFTPTPP